MAIYDIIKAMPLFDAFSEKEKKAFAKMAHVLVTYTNGEMILREKELTSGLYLLLKGNCLVTREQGDNTIRLAKLKPGELFGEMSMVTNLPRRSSVVAKSDVLVLKIDADFFEKVSPKVASKVQNYIIALLCARLDKMNESIMRISSLMHQ
jgi:CRP/FNR family cyclic AMP-dependent transcriptional regulator